MNFDPAVVAFKADLADEESIIERGIGAWNEAGAATRRIRDGKKYRLEHATFEDYCRERWGWSARHAYRMIEAADAAEAMRPIGHTVTNEAQAREVAAIIKTDGPERAAEILTEVAEDGPVTAKAIREAARPTREVTTSETVTVDAETGDILGDILDADAEYRAANLRLDLTKHVKHMRPPIDIDPAEAASLIGDDDVTVAMFRDARRALDAWHDGLERALKSNRRLRVVKGL